MIIETTLQAEFWDSFSTGQIGSPLFNIENQLKIEALANNVAWKRE
jgi:hypothetical protein